MEPTNQHTSPAVPIAIICGFALIAVAIFFTNSNNEKTAAVSTTVEEGMVSDNTPKQVTEADYILGNPNAPILMIEYSDYDCPFCMQFHRTMHNVMDEYGVTGKVAWVYRQFPLAELHPNSPKISESALCVGDIGGQDAFWEFSDLLYGVRREVTELTNVTKIPGYVEEAGVSLDEFNACMKEGRMKQRLEEEMTDGFNSGARGTPYTVIIVGNDQAVIDGAQPYEVVKGVVSNLIDQLEGNFDPNNPPPAIESAPTI